MVTLSAEETQAAACRLAALLLPGDLILLYGDLGAGKTTFTQGFGDGLGVNARVTSPTFTLIQEYAGGRLPLYHFDLYRLAGHDEVFDLGFFDYLERGGVAVVEWPDRLENFVPNERLEVRIESKGEDERRITLVGIGGRYEALVAAVEIEAGPC